MRFLRERTVFQPCDISPARRFDARSTRVRIHVHVSYTYTPRIEVPRSFHWGVCNRVGEPKRGVLGKGLVGEERCTVVFHSHYRNVLPCALVAPRNKSSVTVTMGGAQGGYRRWRGVPGGYRGAVHPFVQPSGKPVRRGMPCNSRNLFFLPFSRSHLGPLVQESSPAFIKAMFDCSWDNKMTMTRIRIRVSTLRLFVIYYLLD